MAGLRVATLAAFWFTSVASASPEGLNLRRVPAAHGGSCAALLKKSLVMQEILKDGRLPLTGPQTGNPTNDATVAAPFGGSTPISPPMDRMYGSGQYAIKQNPRHCAARANDYSRKDFDAAWDYLSCDLYRLFNNSAVVAAFDRALAGMMPVVADASNPPVNYPNPWIGATIVDFVEFFRMYFFMLPTPTGKDTGLSYILKINFLIRRNPAAIDFFNTFKSQTPPATVATTEFFEWTYRWVTARGMWMDSLGSTETVKDWVEYVNSDEQSRNVRANMSAYEGYVPNAPPGYGYKSFNQYFSRIFKDYNESRPISQPADKMVVTAPGDVEVNFILNYLTNETKLPVKGDQFNIKELLNGSALASRFIGGTAVSNVLEPYAYHNFHAPVDGHLLEAVDVPGFFFGIPDGSKWFGSSNTGSPDTEFTVFGGFHRLVMIYDTGKYGLVAQVAVGLADVNTICPTVNSEMGSVPPGSCSGSSCPYVNKGKRMGYFLYGGSLNILLFEPGVFNSMDLLMGNRLGSMSPKARK